MGGRTATPEGLPRTAGEMLARGRSFLERKGLESPRLEAELLVAHALGLDRLRLFLQLDRPLAEAEVAAARALFVRRAQREPVAYITGEREFYGRAFRVGPGVLIPRPETELLVDLTRERASDRTGLRVADFGTGSGCIAITLALELTEPTVAAVEVSDEALGFARGNAEALGAEVHWLAGDGLGALAEMAPLDFLVSNPPYVAPSERASLAPDVREHEPEIALFPPGGERDYWVERLLREGVPLLAPGGFLLCELGYDQGPAALQLAGELGFEAALHPDLDGIDRVLELALPV